MSSSVKYKLNGASKFKEIIISHEGCRVRDLKRNISQKENYDFRFEVMMISTATSKYNSIDDYGYEYDERLNIF